MNKSSSKNLSGKRFGMLTAQNVCGKRNASYLCLCDCGNSRIFPRSELISGHNVSCGCYAGKQTLKHGLSTSNFYRKWDGINSRCNRKSSDSFRRYGGRGIKNEWDSFEEFKNDMYESYLVHVEQHGMSNTTIDRIDVNGNYSKNNCRWLTPKENNNTRADCRYIEYKGEKMTLSQLASKLGIYRIKLHNLARFRNNQQLLEMIENGSIYKTSNGKKLELL